MNATTDLRQQLKSLSIPREQRPRAARSGFRWLGRLILLAVLAGGGYWTWNNRDMLLAKVDEVRTPKVEVATMTVRAQTDQATPPILTATGKIVSDHKVAVVTKVSGQIVDLDFEQGDRVEKGQVLARIEDVNYRARRDEAAAMVEKTRANLAYQKWECARMERIAEGNNATDHELADTRRARDEAVAQLAADEAALVWAEKALRDTEVLAPISGVVLERNVEVGDFVAAEGGRGANANAQFALIADMSKLRVEIDISELDIARVRREMPCRIVPDAYKDRRYDGHVLWIDPGANYAKATVQAKVRIEQPDEFLRVEGTARVDFQSDPAAASSPASVSRIWIPLSAIRTDAPDSAAGKVFVVDKDTLRERAVTIARRVGSQAEISDGLADGQLIVVRDLDKLAEGQRVKLGGS